MKTYLSGKLHNAIVTEANLDYIGSVTVAEDLAQMAGFEENEQVHIWDITNGHRIITYVILGPSGSGCIKINGGAAHSISVGDRVVIASFCHLDRLSAEDHTPSIVILGEGNAPVSE